MQYRIDLRNSLCCGIILRGPLAQLAEQLTLNQLVQGSSPWRPTTRPLPLRKFFGSVFSAPPCRLFPSPPRLVFPPEDAGIGARQRSACAPILTASDATMG